MLKRNIKRIIGVVLALLVVAFLVFNKGGFLSKRNDRSGFVSGRSIATLPVSAMVAKSLPLQDKVVAAGTLMADERVDIAAEAAGRIVSIHFEEGKMVRQGDLLVTINNADLQAQKARNGYQLQLATEREARQRALFERQGISQQAYDQVLTELNSLKAEAALLQAQLDKTIIRAPFSGVLGLRQLSEGSFVSSGTKIVSLARTQPIKIEFSVPEKYASLLAKGVMIYFEAEGVAGRFEAKVYAVEPVIDQRSRSITARALFPNIGNILLPGAFAKVEMPLHHLQSALQVRTEAIIPELGSSKVFVYRNGKAAPVLVSTGIRTASMIQITEGLNEGDTVITSGLLQLRPGMSIELTKID
jgi:membrane fusion protein (multidrug efflux system)